MTRTKKISAIAIMFFLMGGATAVYAQVPQTNEPPSSPTMDQSPVQPTPQETAPQQQVPQMDQQQNNTPDINLSPSQGTAQVSDKDLKDFAAIYPKVQAEGEKAQQKMAAVIEKDGMKLDRFNEIQTAKLQNQKSDASPEELKTFDKITGDLDALQPDIQKGMESLIKSSGMSLEKFQTIASAIQTDKDVQSRFQKIMGGGGNPG